MENITNYTEVLSVEERTNLENLINKLAVIGIKQYNTQAATILFEKRDSLITSERENDSLEKINIAELLKNCPRGMELDCTMYEDCKFLDVGEDSSNSYLIRITTPCGIKYLDKYGRYTNDDKAKCVIFPKGKTTWEGFVPPCKFKDGDIIFVKSKKSGTELISIYRDESSHLFYDHCSVSLNSEHFYFMSTPGFIPKNETSINRLATEEEKRKLFDAIKENGCKWNAETKTLEKLIVPKFKVDDRIRHRLTGDVYKVLFVLSNGSLMVNEIGKRIDVKEQDNYELINKPKFKIGDRIKHKILNFTHRIIDIKD